MKALDAMDIVTNTVVRVALLRVLEGVLETVNTLAVVRALMRVLEGVLATAITLVAEAVNHQVVDRKPNAQLLIW